MNFTKFDSNEEQYFELWLDELLFHGYIDNYVYQPEAYKINDVVEYGILVHMKTKDKLVSKTLLRAREYTPDYHIFWNEKAKGIFYQNLGEIENTRPIMIANKDVTTLDVKGTHNQHSSWGIFEANRKDVWEKYCVFVEKVTPIGKKACLFGLTFTPSDLPMWQKRDPSKKYAWVKWPVRTIKEFVDNMKKL
jgi:hypothetical protein